MAFTIDGGLIGKSNNVKINKPKLDNYSNTTNKQRFSNVP